MTAPPAQAARLGLAGLALSCLAVLGMLTIPAAQAAPQPDEIPGDFRNGQENAFAAVAMVPYLQAQGGGAVPVEARFWLRDLETVRRANDLLFAFNLKGDGATARLDSLTTADGKALVPTQTATVDGGRQPQAHFAPADLLAVAGNGSQPLELVLRGHVEPTANGQIHLGAMVIAFDAGWATLATADGPAQVYGFTLVMATGLAGGAMPFHGQGNTWWIVPIAALAVVVALAGAAAVSALHAAVPLTPLPPPVRSAPAPAAARPAAATKAMATAIPVFGGPSPASAPPVRAAVARAGPIQGPVLPPPSHPPSHPPSPPPSRPSRPLVAQPAASPRQQRQAAPAALATAVASVPARPTSATPTAANPSPKPRTATARRPAKASPAKAKAPARAGRVGVARKG